MHHSELGFVYIFYKIVPISVVTAPKSTARCCTNLSDAHPYRPT